MRRFQAAMATKLAQTKDAAQTDIPGQNIKNQVPGARLPPASATARGGVLLSDANPAPNGTADPGVSSAASRADHVHDAGAGGGSALTIEEVDGTPTESAPTKLIFPNGTLSVSSHEVTYTPTGGGGVLDYILIEDQKSSGTNGGTFTSGAWRTRDLNTEVVDTGGHASVASNQITLAAGTYRCRASAPAYNCGFHQARLYDTTNSAVLIVGTSEYQPGGGADPPITRSWVEGRLTIAGSTVIEVQHQCQSTRATVGLGGGVGAAFTVTHEVYARVELWRE